MAMREDWDYDAMDVDDYDDTWDWDEDYPAFPGRERFRPFERLRVWARGKVTPIVAGFAEQFLPAPPVPPAPRSPAQDISISALWKDRELFRITLEYDGAGGLHWVSSDNQHYYSTMGNFTFVLPDEAVRLVLDGQVWGLLEVVPAHGLPVNPR